MIEFILFSPIQRFAIVAKFLLISASVLLFCAYSTTIAKKKCLLYGHWTADWATCRCSGRASELEFDNVTPQWPANIAKLMAVDAMLHSW